MAEDPYRTTTTEDEARQSAERIRELVANLNGELSRAALLGLRVDIDQVGTQTLGRRGVGKVPVLMVQVYLPA